MQKDYTIARANTIDQLIDKVKSLQKGGWVAIGGYGSVPALEGGPTYTQTLVLPGSKKKVSPTVTAASPKD